MPYYQCHDCYKLIHIDTESVDSCPLCGGTDGEVMSDEEHDKAVEEGYLFHEDTD